MLACNRALTQPRASGRILLEFLRADLDIRLTLGNISFTVKLREFLGDANMQADNPNGWGAQDFIDQAEPSLSHDDPWDPLSLLRQSPSPGSADRSIPQPSRAATISEEDEQSRLGGDVTESYTSQTTETLKDEADFPAEWFHDDPDVESDEGVSRRPYSHC